MAPLLSVGERFFQLAMLLIAVWEGACHHTLVLAISGKDLGKSAKCRYKYLDVRL